MQAIRLQDLMSEHVHHLSNDYSTVLLCIYHFSCNIFICIESNIFFQIINRVVKEFVTPLICKGENRSGKAHAYRSKINTCLHGDHCLHIHLQFSNQPKMAFPNFIIVTFYLFFISYLASSTQHCQD